jgi:uncharacterized protein
MRSISFIWTFLFMLPLFAAEYTGEKVVDEANMFSREEESSLSQKIEMVEDGSRVEIVILTLNTTENQSIESFSIRTANKWKIGRENGYKGILITIAKLDRKIRLEVGYGLEDQITDQRAQHIIDEIITPNFRSGHYYNGVNMALSKIDRFIGHDGAVTYEQEQYEVTDTPQKVEEEPIQRKYAQKKEEAIWPTILFFAVFIMTIILVFTTKWYVSSGMGFLMGYFYGEYFFHFWPANLVFGLFLFAVGLSKLGPRKPIGKDRITSGYFGGPSGGYSSGGFSGFSGGGGGGFGGGGATGSW